MKWTRGGVAAARKFLCRLLGRRETGLPEGFVRLGDVAPAIRQDLRYAGRENFLGRPVPGYRCADCWLRREVAAALVKVAAEAARMGFRLIVYDCYRPQRATQAFIAWAADEADQKMKAEYYPHLAKSEIFPRGYISKNSQHSLGIAVDIAFVGKDFGTPFDLFDDSSATDYPGVSAEARINRKALFDLMIKHGFENLPQEWWHFSYKGVSDAVPLDVEIM
jgi:zinc D-Ala-D-Ala dipeptidase